MRNALFLFITLCVMVACSKPASTLEEMCYSPSKTVFSVFSPTAQQVVLNLYADAESETALQNIPMKPAENGRWTCTVKGDQLGRYYTFLVTDSTSQYRLHETPGIFAKAVSVNGRRAAIIDLRATDPEGWSEDVRPALAGPQDAIIYEMHHRDMSIHPSAGTHHPGKFLAMTEHGTHNADGLSTGIDHLIELGVTHVQILPSYDYGSVDEERLNEPQYNWGYDPVNYNVPEGSYSTNPYDPTCRIYELKSMIQALHKAGIRVIMDVVYNHTFDVENSQFTQTAPGYFYRLTEDGYLGNASGCGNETASEQEMMRRFIVESCRYWVEEYHMDGFRFDLMGIHDVTTMRAVRQMLDEHDPTLLLYGEGWAAGSPLYPADSLAMKVNVPNMPGIGAFCDDMRDAIRGPFSDDHQPAWLDAQPGHEESIKFGLVGCIAHPDVDMSRVNYSREPWTAQPTQCMAYVSCHDDMMLSDRLLASIKLQPGEQERLDKLAQTAVLTSQGIPFLWCGEEVLRDKKGVHNSYCSPDSINAIDWSLKTAHQNLTRYYQGLIALRKAHPAFHMGDAELVRQHMHFLPVPAGVVAYTLTDHAAGDEWQTILVVLNANREEVTLDVPAGDYTVVVANGQCLTTTDDLHQTSAADCRFSGTSVTVAPQSALIAHD